MRIIYRHSFVVSTDTDGSYNICVCAILSLDYAPLLLTRIPCCGLNDFGGQLVPLWTPLIPALYLPGVPFSKKMS